MRRTGTFLLLGFTLGGLAFESAACDESSSPSATTTAPDASFEATSPTSGFDAGPPLPACAPADGTVSVTSTWPVDKEPHALRLPSINLKFDGEVDCPKAQPLVLYTDTGPVPLSDPGACSGGYAFYDAKPKEDLAYGKTYTLRIEGFTDTQGKPIAACQTTFTVKSKTAAIVSDGETTLARDEDGTIWIWGEQLANKKTLSDVPGVVDVGGKVVAMSVNTSGASLAALADGTVIAWGGTNQSGQLGRGTATDEWTLGKVQLTLPAGITITGVSSSAEHCLALRSDGKVMGWGRNDNGELADGTLGVVNGDPRHMKLTPVEIAGLTDIVQVVAAAGSTGHGVYEGGYSLVLKKDGSMWGFGSNAFGAINQVIPYNPPPGYDVRYPTPTATQVKTATALAGGNDFGLALLGDGTVRSWEIATDGEIGNGTCTDNVGYNGADVPADLRTVAGNGGALGNVKSITAGAQFAFAVLGDGTVWGWGRNDMGQLGDGSSGQTNRSCMPKAVAITDVVQAAAGGNASFLLKKDGSVWAAGYNTNNKLGTGGDAYITTFTRVPGL